MMESIHDPEVHSVFQQARRPRQKDITVDGVKTRIPFPFPSPEDWRDQWVYFIFLDRFNNPTAPPKHLPWNEEWGEFQGGTINGIRERLAYIRSLGAGAIWISPILKNCQYTPFTYHGYGIQDFLTVEPRFTSDPARAKKDPAFADAELQALVDEAHARGLYVIFDVVLNHTGDVFVYKDLGASAPWSDAPYPIQWRDESGRPRMDWESAPESCAPDAAVWPTELRQNGYFRRKGKGGEAAGDFEVLKELVTDYQEYDPVYGVHYPVRETLIRAYQYLVAKFDIDGFRIDTLKFIERDFARQFANAIREFAVSIGKKDFFTFGEIWDSEEKIASYIGRNTTDNTDIVGVDAAVDFPLYYKLSSVIKGQSAPVDLVNMYERRRSLESGVISSQGEASKFFVTFLDNHDQNSRFYFEDAGAPKRYDGQLTSALACLFSLQGIPCLYYGTEQGLHGSGGRPEAVREALWGKPNAFSESHPFYQSIARLAAVRAGIPALRFGRQYFRPISGDGSHFGISNYPGGVLAFSRILSGMEVIVVVNTCVDSGWQGEVLVDFSLNHPGEEFRILFSNRENPNRPGSICERPLGQVEIFETDGSVSHGPTRSLPVALAPMEALIVGSTALPELE
jgi:glycosidase